EGVDRGAGGARWPGCAMVEGIAAPAPGRRATAGGGAERGGGTSRAARREIACPGAIGARARTGRPGRMAGPEDGQRAPGARRAPGAGAAHTPAHREELAMHDLAQVPPHASAPSSSPSASAPPLASRGSTASPAVTAPEGAALTRRQLLGWGAALAAGAGVGTAPLRRAAAQGGGRVVYATWGGSWEKAIRQAWFEPFTKKTGIQVVSVTGPDYGKVRAMVQARRTEWDVVEVNPDFQWIGQREGLLEPLDFRIIDRSGIMAGPDLVTDYSVPQV